VRQTRGHLPLRAALIPLLLVLGWQAPVCAASNITLVARPFQNPGPTNDVIVAANLSPADGVSAIDLVYRYDATRLTPVGVYRTGLTKNFTLTSSLSTSGFVEIHLTGGTSLAGSGEVAWVDFRSVGSWTGTTTFTWSSAVLNGGAIPVTKQGMNLVVEQAPVTVSVPDTAKGAPASQVVVPIIATAFTGASSFDLAISFNPAVIAPASVQTTSLTSCMSAVSNLTSPGVATIALYGVCSVSGSGAIAQVVFNVVGQTGSSTPINVTRAGINEGGIKTVLDDGLFLACTTVDYDGDGFSSCAGDCNEASAAVHPGAPEICNGADDNCNGQVDDVALPQAGQSIAVGEPVPGTAMISWPSVPGATRCDVVRGSLTLLHASGGDFSVATGQCLADDLTSSFLADAAVPAPGGGFWYLVRPENCGGFGSYQAGAASQVGFRDPGIGGSPNRCQ
jgi:hypothetical protein